MSKPLDREQALIRAFVVPQPEERHRELPATPICRSDARFKRLDTGFALPATEPFPDLSNPAIQGARDVCQVVLSGERSTSRGCTAVALEGIGVSTRLPSGVEGRLG